MAGSCCINFSRYIIGFINFLILIAICGVGLAMYLKLKDMPFEKMVKIDTTYALVLAAGCVVMLCVLLGFFMLCCKNKCIYWVYLILILVALILECLTIAFAFTHPAYVMEQIEKNYYSESLEIYRKSIEQTLKCCGFSTVNTTDCGYNTTSNVCSCKGKIENEISKNYKVIGIVLIAVALIEFVIVVCAMSLACIEEDKKEAVDITQL